MRPRFFDVKVIRGLCASGLLILGLSACRHSVIRYESRSEPISTQNFQDYDEEQTSAGSTIVRGRSHWEAGHECGRNCSEYEPPILDARPIESSPRRRTVVVYEHGHESHICAGFCSHYVPQTVIYQHGQTLHRCGTSCRFYSQRLRVYQHGHNLHNCGYGCRFYTSRTTTVIFAHGHARHVCNSRCGFFRTTRTRVYLHGHHLHRCASGCRFFGGGIRYTFSHGHHRHRCNSGCNSYRRRGFQRGHHRSRRRGKKINLGFGASFRIR